MFGVFALLSVFYIGVGVWTLIQVIRRWSSMFGPRPTDEDAQLATKASFFLLIPPTVLLHELGHAIAIWAAGDEVVSWGFIGYMGWVQPSPQSPDAQFASALAGNVVTLLIGIGAIELGVRRPGGRVRNILILELGRLSLILVLIFYPLLSLAFGGDFRMIYDFDETPVASAITAAFHGVILFGGHRFVWTPRWLPMMRLLESPYAEGLRALEQRLAEAPDDPIAHRELGIMLVEAGDFKRARRHLERAHQSGIDPRSSLALGLALLELGEVDAALERLEWSAERLLRPEHRQLADTLLERARKLKAG